MGEKFWIQEVEKDRRENLTEKNLDRLSAFLCRELEHPALASQIPNRTHIFHGSYNDHDLTRANLELASNVLLGMTLGYVEEAPLMMIFEYSSGQDALIDLSSEVYRREAQDFVAMFHRRSRQEMTQQITELVLA
jgi:hypothetical protein